MLKLTTDKDEASRGLSATAKHLVSPYASPIILVLPASNIFTKFGRGHPCGGAKYRWGIKISRFSTNKSLYLANDTKYRHSYYGRRIGTHMRSIKWCHFQWPWTNRNPVFKVTPLFDDKYFTNGYRYGHSYYTPCPGKKGATDFFCYNFYKYWRIFIIFRAQLRKTMPKSLA